MLHVKIGVGGLEKRKKRDKPSLEKLKNSSGIRRGSLQETITQKEIYLNNLS